MARPVRIIYPGAYYHVTSRGNERRDVFKSKRDREKFLSYLESATERYNAKIHVYCLMSNHYHLLLETPDGNLPEIMHHINGAYTTYFNVKRKRTGHLFQGRYKAILIEADAYATELSRYIHLNPVRVGIVSHPEEFVWSSYRDYTTKRSTPPWLKTDFILGYFAAKPVESREKYRAFVEDMLGKKSESPFKGIFGSSILGGPDFIEEISAAHLNEDDEKRNIPLMQRHIMRPTLEKLIETVRGIFGNDDKIARQASIHICHQYSGVRLKEIAAKFSIGETAIIEASRRFAKKIDDDAKLRARVEKVKETLKSEL